MTDAWQADARPIPPELAPEYVHADYSPTPISDRLSGVSVMDRYEGATVAELMAMCHGIGNPDKTTNVP